MNFKRIPTNIYASPGDLVRFKELGIQVSADVNAPEFGSQPYVTINTEDLAPRFTYDPETGLRGDASPYTYEQDGASAVVRDERSAVVARHFPYPHSDDALRSASDHARSLNDAWHERCGMPIIAVHLNDGTIYDDEGAGPIHRTDTPKTDRLKLAEDILRRVGRVLNSERAQHYDDLSAYGAEITTFLAL